ncbi:MAG: thioredoxin domain-containing protein, partial [Pseudomonadota bacterium]
ESPASRLLQLATRAAEFLQRELYDPARGVLYRSYREGRGAVEGFAEDYAFLIQGLLDLYEAGFELRWLQWAERLQRTMDAVFWDEGGGGYFNSAAGDANLVLRLKEDYDGAEPAPSSVAAMNLLRLGAVFDPPEGGSVVGQPGGLASQVSDLAYSDRARRTLGAFQAQWGGAPQAMPQMLCALELALSAPRHVVLAGDPAAADFRSLAAVLHEKSGPCRSLLAVTSEEDRRWFAPRAPWLAEMRPLEGRATAFVCEEFACQAPVTEPAALRSLLGR